MGWMADSYLAKKAAAQAAPETPVAESTQSIEPRATEVKLVPDTDRVPDEDTFADDFWIPEDWREDWEERAAIMEQEGGLSAEQAQAEAALSVIQVKHPQGKLAADWLREVREARRGRLPDWRSWSAPCRTNWAGQMIRMAQEGGFLRLAGESGRAWLESLMQRELPDQQAIGDPSMLRKRQNGGRAPPAAPDQRCVHCGAH